MTSYVIHLIRHGVSEGNLLGQYIGSTDSPLSQRGKDELVKLEKSGEYPKAEAFYSSPMSRCTETMKILYPDANPVLIEDFRENDFGDWEQKKMEDLKDSDPVFAEWIKGSPTVAPPNGESIAGFMYRVCARFEKLVNDMMRSGQTSAVLVTHGGVIMAILSSYGLPRAKFYDWMTQNGCGYSIRITPGLWMRSMVAEVYQELPVREQKAKKEYTVMDAAREAADRAFGQKDVDKEKEQ